MTSSKNKTLPINNCNICLLPVLKDEFPDYYVKFIFNGALHEFHKVCILQASYVYNAIIALQKDMVKGKYQ